MPRSPRRRASSRWKCCSGLPRGGCRSVRGGRHEPSPARTRSVRCPGPARKPAARRSVGARFGLRERRAAGAVEADPLRGSVRSSQGNFGPGLEVMLAATDGASHRTEDPQDGADHDEDASDGGQKRNMGQHADEEEDDTKDDHFDSDLQVSSDRAALPATRKHLCTHSPHEQVLCRALCRATCVCPAPAALCMACHLHLSARAGHQDLLGDGRPRDRPRRGARCRRGKVSEQRWGPDRRTDPAPTRGPGFSSRSPLPPRCRVSGRSS